MTRNEIRTVDVATGLFVVVCGMSLFVMPALTTIAVGVFLGWILLIAGATSIFAGIRNAHHRVWAIATGGVTVVVGGYLAANPLVAAETLVLMVMISILSQAIGGFYMAFALPGHRILGIIVGLINLILAYVLFNIGSLNDARLIGIYVGFTVVMSGFMMIFSDHSSPDGIAD